MQIQPETIIWNQPSATSKPVARNEVFRMQKSGDDRINGSIPVWGSPQTPEEEITANLATSAKGAKDPSFATALAETAPDAGTTKDESFGFLDIVDMVNPLQHIPLVSTAYREITGDTIKPISRIIGGAAYGGFIGAAAGAANAVVEYETGKDVGENVVAMAEGQKTHEAAVATAANTPDTDTTIAVANLRAPQPHYNS